MAETVSQQVRIPVGKVALEGILSIPAGARGIVLFAHGSGSSRLSPRNTYVARVLQDGGIGTLLFDLLTREEDTVYATRFDIDLLAERLVETTRWLTGRPEGKAIALGYFGASTGAAAALQGAAKLGEPISAVVSRGGRPDLAMPYLPEVTAPTLLIVGEHDREVLRLNCEVLARLASPKELAVVPGATHLFEEPGALEEAARLAKEWFLRYLQ